MPIWVDGLDYEAYLIMIPQSMNNLPIGFAATLANLVQKPILAQAGGIEEGAFSEGVEVLNHGPRESLIPGSSIGSREGLGGGSLGGVLINGEQQVYGESAGHVARKDTRMKWDGVLTR